MNLNQINIMKVLCSEDAGFTVSDIALATGLDSGDVLSAIRKLKDQLRVMRVGDKYKATIAACDIPAAPQQNSLQNDNPPDDSDQGARVLRFLEANPKGHLPKAIREALNIDKHVLTSLLKQLKQQGAVSNNSNGFYFFGEPVARQPTAPKAPKKVVSNNTKQLDNELDNLQLLRLQSPLLTKKMLSKFKCLVPANGPNAKLLDELLQQIPRGA